MPGEDKSAWMVQSMRNNDKHVDFGDVAKDPAASLAYLKHHTGIDAKPTEADVNAMIVSVSRDPKLAIDYAVNVLHGRFPWFEDHIISLLHQEEQQGEAVLDALKYQKTLSDHQIRCSFVEDTIPPASVVFSGTGGYASPRLLEHYEHHISTSARASLLYAKSVLGSRFSLGEAALIKDGVVALNYAVEVLKGRFPAYEEYIEGCEEEEAAYKAALKGAGIAYSDEPPGSDDMGAIACLEHTGCRAYTFEANAIFRAKYSHDEDTKLEWWLKLARYQEAAANLGIECDALTKNVPADMLVTLIKDHSVEVADAERVISESSVASRRYAVEVLKGRFPPYERRMSSLGWSTSLNVGEGIKYATAMKCRIPALEEVLVVSHRGYSGMETLVAYQMGLTALGVECSLIEDTFTPFQVVTAAVAEGARIPLLENYIASNDFAAVWYAKSVVEGPFPKCEVAVSGGVNHALARDYAENVLGGRFGLYEDRLLAFIGRRPTEEDIDALIDYFSAMEGMWIRCDNVYARLYMEYIVDVAASTKEYHGPFNRLSEFFSGDRLRDAMEPLEVRRDGVHNSLYKERESGASQVLDEESKVDEKPTDVDSAIDHARRTRTRSYTFESEMLGLATLGLAKGDLGVWVDLLRYQTALVGMDVPCDVFEANASPRLAGMLARNYTVPGSVVEPVIAASNVESLRYALKVKNGRFLAYEKAMCSPGWAHKPSNVSAGIHYAKLVRTRVPELESALCDIARAHDDMTPLLTYQESVKSVGIDCSIVENAYDPYRIATTAVRQNIDHRLVAPYVSGDPSSAFVYASRVKKGPFPEGEPAIARDGEYALAYAESVLGGRFEAYENLMLESIGPYTDDYIDELIHYYEAMDNIGVTCYDILHRLYDAYILGYNINAAAYEGPFDSLRVFFDKEMLTLEEAGNTREPKKETIMSDVVLDSVYGGAPNVVIASGAKGASAFEAMAVGAQVGVIGGANKEAARAILEYIGAYDDWPESFVVVAEGVIMALIPLLIRAVLAYSHKFGLVLDQYTVRRLEYIAGAGEQYLGQHTGTKVIELLGDLMRGTMEDYAQAGTILLSLDEVSGCDTVQANTVQANTRTQVGAK